MEKIEYKISDQLVIGGGVIGLCTAYFLAEEGYSVTVIDKGPGIEAASHGNCGLISPSHALPLNNYKLMRKAFGWMFQSNAPFYIKPQLDFSLMCWLVKFALNANKKKVHQSMIARHSLLTSSKELYKDIIAKNALDCSWQDKGILFVCKEERTFDDLSKNIDFTRNELGLSAHSFVGSDLQSKEPALKEDIYGGWLYDVDAFLKPDEFISELTKRLVDRGVKIMKGEEVREFRVNGNCIEHVKTKNKLFKVNNVILTAGALTPVITKSLGLKIPIVPGKGYSITMKSPKDAPKIPCIMQERKTVATPWNNRGYRLGGTMEFSGYSKGLNKRRLQALKNAGEEYLKNPHTDEIMEEWWGWRSMTPDGVPIVSKTGKYKNLILGCGHNMLGMSLATGTGKLISEMVSGKSTHVDLANYSLNRF